MNPCVKFYRNIVDWKWFHVPEMVQLIIWFVCKADHKPYEVDGVMVLRGQVCATRKEIIGELGMSEQTFRTCMKRFVNDGYLTTETELWRKMIVTVSNFERYLIEEPAPIINRQEIAQVPVPATPSPQITTPQSAAIEEIAVEVEPTKVEASSSPTLFEFEPEEAEPPKATSRKKKRDEIDYDFIVRLFHDRCPSLPKVLKLSDKRKQKMRIRFEEMQFSYETLQEVFDRIEASKFMRGDNNRGWRCDFDWIFSNSDNWTKVLEGKYDNRETIIMPNGTTPHHSAGSAVGYPTAADRNAVNSTRQKCDILNTLAKCQQDYESGNIPALTGVEENL